MMKDKRGDASYKRPAIIAGLIGIGIFIGWLGWSWTNNSSAFMKCKVSSKDYRVAKLYDGEGKLDMTIYGYSYADQVSEELMAASSQQGAAPQVLYHNFYKGTLCNNTVCSGIVLDIGANLGTHGLYLAKLGYEVHSFEVFKDSAALLRCSASANGFGRRMVVVQEGVSDRVGQECLLSPEQGSSHLAMLAPKSVGNCSHYPPAQVNVVSLDHYWKNMLKEKQVEFIKIDVEAHELYVLQGASQMLAAKPPPMILMEYFPKLMKLKSVSALTLLNTITSANYRVYDCQEQVEVPKGAAGLKMLDKYSTDNTATDLLLLHTSKYPATTVIAPKSIKCGY